MLLAVLLASPLAARTWASPKYKVLHAFGTGSDLGGLWSSLVLDGHGRLYGTATGGGAYGGGGVFRLSPRADGRWTETILHSFNGKDGAMAFGGLLLDARGILYGTTEGGGEHYGNVFELSPGTGGWQETVLYNFPLPGGGCCPYAGVVRDNSGNLFGVTYSAYRLARGSKGWKATVLHNFTGNRGDGSGPYAVPILDASGNLYGTTEGGGNYRCGGGCGTVYELSPQPDGKWKETILHRFQASWDGAFPGVGALVLDDSGNLYGTAQGGSSGHGVIFKLSRSSSGRWKETVLYDIPGGPSGADPSAGVVMDKAGDLFGTTSVGGDPNCNCGVVYELSPAANDKWTYTVLHRFVGSDGALPDANLILDDKGNLYGTASAGGAFGYGVAFELTP